MSGIYVYKVGYKMKKIKKMKVKVGIDKSKLIKGDKRLIACGKNF
ncbi:MAG: hypothetical protein ACJAX4_004653 [Clostridium sp.]|jgi:hypothetical protein